MNVPRGVSASDRIEALRWLSEYRQAIRRQHPFWFIKFEQHSPDLYVLKVQPMQDAQQVCADAYSSTHSSWRDLVETYGG